MAWVHQTLAENSRYDKQIHLYKSIAFLHTNIYTYKYKYFSQKITQNGAKKKLNLNLMRWNNQKIYVSSTLRGIGVGEEILNRKSFFSRIKTSNWQVGHRETKELLHS